MAEPPTLVFFDGVCGLCDRLVQFLLPRDRHDRLRFATLQSDLAHDVLTRHGEDPRQLETFFVVDAYGTERERVLARGRAAILLARRLGGVYALARVASILPTFLLDAIYRVVANNRYRWFGKREACRVPSPDERAKFLAS